eukprot:GEMP01092169.1.p1 GENE.GEMP01092169.1~~GEMP01092169.1.p1  ORF type:complete len:108 (-),score=1.00 GEMP01092169.1:128-451(-)
MARYAFITVETAGIQKCFFFSEIFQIGKTHNLNKKKQILFFQRKRVFEFKQQKTTKTSLRKKSVGLFSIKQNQQKLRKKQLGVSTLNIYSTCTSLLFSIGDGKSPIG